MESPPTTFTRKTRTRQIILGVLVTALIVALVVAVIVLAILLDRKKIDDRDGGDKGTQTDETVVQMSLSFIESSGIVGNSITVNVSYRAPIEHTTDWFIRYSAADTYRTGGIVRSYGDDPNNFSTQVTIHDVMGISVAYLRLYSKTQYVTIRFNNSAHIDEGSATITAWRNRIVDIEDSITAIPDTNLTLNVIVKFDSEFLKMLNESSKSIQDLFLEFGDIVIDAVNTTADPHVLFEAFNGFPANIFFVDVANINETTFNFTITVLEEYVQYGGLLILTIPDISSTGYISEIRHGYVVRILSPQSNTVVAENSVALYPLANETYIFTKRATLICFAMGSPPPKVIIYKEGQDQVYHSLRSGQEDLVKDDYTHMIGYTVAANDTNNQGRYLCRATSNQATTETTTEVIFAEPPVINVTESGVIENTTEKITIKCQGAGKPRPTFQLNLFYDYGPDLIKTGLYQVTESSPDWTTSFVTLTISPLDPAIHTIYCQVMIEGRQVAESFPDQTTSVVTLTISPPDPAIHTVYCVTFPHDNGPAHKMKIEVFPFDESDGVDWNLYDRMNNLVYGNNNNQS